MERYYSFAELDICIHGDDSYMYTKEGNLAFFKKEYIEACEHFYFTLVDVLEEEKGIVKAKDASFVQYEDNGKTIRYVGSSQDAYMRIEQDGHSHYVSIKRSSIRDVIPVHTIYSAMNTEKLLSQKEGIMMHASYIEVEGKAILFTAPSGTGKSTQASLWEKYRGATIINGDRVAIVKKEDGFYACGVPFAGSSNICKNKDLKIETIVFLSQAKENIITKINGFEAFLYLYEGSGIQVWDKNHVEMVSDILHKIIKTIPIYKLECTPDEKAVKVLEEKLEGR